MFLTAGAPRTLFIAVVGPGRAGERREPAQLNWANHRDIQ
jgi:hypothetical protein